MPTPAERAQREEAEKRRRQENDHQLLLCLQKRQTDANVVIARLTGALVIVSIVSGFVAYLQFNAAKKSADAAKSAADTANLSLHLSERAYLVIGAATVDPSHKSLTIPFSNTGRIPSAGPADAVIHEATYAMDSTGKVIGVSETHWARRPLPPLAAGHPFNFSVSVPLIDVGKLRTARQAVTFGGYVTYGDGFSDDDPQTLTICSQMSYSAASNQIILVPCEDSAVSIQQMEKLDGFPKNEQKN